MACGCALVTTSNGGSDEFAHHQQTALVCSASRTRKPWPITSSRSCEQHILRVQLARKGSPVCRTVRFGTKRGAARIVSERIRRERDPTRNPFTKGRGIACDHCRARLSSPDRLPSARPRRAHLGLPPVPARVPAPRLGRAVPRPARARDVRGRPRRPTRFESSANLATCRGDGRLRLGDGCRCSRLGPRGRRRARERGLDARGARRCLLNVMGYLDDEEMLAAAPRRVFLDIDPGFGQMWRELGLARRVRRPRPLRHGRRANVGRPGARSRPAGSTGSRRCSRSCSTSGPPCRGGGRARSRASRAGAGRSARSSTAGERYGLRVHEFRRFVELPRASRRARSRSRSTSTTPTTRGPARARARRLAARRPARGRRRPVALPRLRPRLARRSSWSPRACTSTRGAAGSATAASATSRAAGRCSPRTPGSTASSRPARGCVTFATLEEAVAGARRVHGDYRATRRAARALAEEHFDSDHVLRAAARRARWSA